MSSPELENLAKIGKLKREPASPKELEGLRRSGLAHLVDASVQGLSFLGRFGAAYGAAHALALYALRRLGYRSDNRYLLFQTLQHTVGLPTEVWRVLAKAHEKRNAAEYHGQIDEDERLLAELMAAAKRLRDTIEKLPK
jgi:hypothetical protein